MTLYYSLPLPRMSYRWWQRGHPGDYTQVASKLDGLFVILSAEINVCSHGRGLIPLLASFIIFLVPASRSRGSRSQVS